MRLALGAIMLCEFGAMFAGIQHPSHAAPAPEAADRCGALRRADFSQIPDADTEIIQAQTRAAESGAPSYCELTGYVAPSIRFRLQLPDISWNGKFIELGCGGTCGSMEHIAECNVPLRRGYACIVSDGGNSSGGGDMKWAYNEPDAVIRYVARASHVTAIIGKTIAERFYTKRPSRSYFIGCSAGGMQGMMEAERFPWDFDGIVAGDPSLSVSEDWLNLVWAHRALMDDRGNAILASKDLETLHRAVIAQCDMNDGVKDGLIGDPRRCNFDPEKLSCVAGFGQTCLSSTQIESVRKIYQGPVTSEGRSITPRHVFVGSELSWHDWFGGSERASTGTYSYMPEWFRYYLFQPNPGPSWSVESLDFDRDYQRFGLAELTEPVNPDLRRLQRKGGKLILYTGWDDPVAGVGRAIDYYESAERLIGGRTKTQEFFRLFVIPGMNHCTGGEGAFAIDYLSALEAWVEEGHAPSELEAAHVKVDDLLDKATQGDAEAWHELQRRLQFPLDPTHVEFSRPIYPYPIQTHYLGHGNRNEAASFGPVSAPRMDP